jgi:hypothetical protein
VEPQEYDEIIRHLVRIAAHQDSINADLRASLQEQREFNVRQLEINQHLDITQARIETLLARMIAQQDNGRDV